MYDLRDDIYSGRPRALGGRENHVLSSRPSLDDRLQAQGSYRLTGVGNHVFISLRQREHCLRDVALRIVPLDPCKLLGTH